MANAVKKGKSKPRSRWNPYPWDKWFQRRSFTLVRGKDFKGQVHSMVAQIRKAAKSNGRKYHPSIQVDNSTITVTMG